MTHQANPYDAPPENQLPELPLRIKIIAACFGLFTMAGAAATLGTFLFGLLILIAGKTQPSPVSTDALIGSPLQMMVFGIGTFFLLMTSLAAGAWVVFRILKSQRMTADVLYRRQQLQVAVIELQAAVRDREITSVTSRDHPQSVS